MALCPFATVRLIPRHNKVRMLEYNRVNCHQAVSNSLSLFGYFSGVKDCSHFYINEYGGLEQYIDTYYMSAADYQGSDATVSVETWDGGGNVLTWNEAQLSMLVRLFIWITDTHPSIPRRLATSSAYGAPSKGLSWHRLGVDSYPTLYKPGWRQPNGMKYSKSRGKTCPGDGRIAQMPEIMARVHGTNPAPAPTPVPVPPPEPEPEKENDEMGIIIRDEVSGRAIHVVGGLGVKILGGTELAKLIKSGVPQANVSPGQFNEYAKRFPLS